MQTVALRMTLDNMCMMCNVVSVLRMYGTFDKKVNVLRPYVSMCKLVRP